MNTQQNENKLKAAWVNHAKSNLHADVQQTITEHKTVMQLWDELYEQEKAGVRTIEKDIYTEVEETLAEHKRVMQRWEVILSNEQGRYYEMIQNLAA